MSSTSSSSSVEMRIVFIHSGKEYFKNLGPHYTPLIKHTLSLLPIKQYLALRSIRDKDKFRAIEALPRGAIIGVALFDKSFWFNTAHSQNPWAHGPYCYHIKDAFRLQNPIQCRGLPGIWTMDKKTQTRIQSLPRITAKIAEWKTRYDICNKSESCLTVMQPFAEAIVRKMKTIENRLSKVFRLSLNDGQFAGCRVCLNDVQNYKNAYAQTVDNITWNRNIPKYSKDTNYKYHRTATLTECQCKKNKASKRTKTASRKSTNKNDTKRRKKSKLHLKPLPDYNGMTTRRKPSKKRKLSKLINYGSYYDKKKRYDLRDQNGNTCYKQLVAMGYDAEAARGAAKNCANVNEGVAYLAKMESVQMDVSLGYSAQLRRKKKRRREHMEVDCEEIDAYERNHNKKRRKLNDNYSEYEDILKSDQYNESKAIDEAIKASQSTYQSESRWTNVSSKYERIPKRRCD